jgi:3-methyladenine DNA glycosylase AlkC
VAASLKTFFSPALVRRLAADIARVHPGFHEQAFIEHACETLEELELLDRGRHIANALARHLPQHYPEAITVLLRSLGPEHASDELIGGGMAPFYYLPHTVFVAERGLADFDLSMHAQYELTKRFSAEASIRPFIARDPERTPMHDCSSGQPTLMLMSGASSPKVRGCACHGQAASPGWKQTPSASWSSSSA